MDGLRVHLSGQLSVDLKLSWEEIAYSIQKRLRACTRVTAVSILCHGRPVGHIPRMIDIRSRGSQIRIFCRVRHIDARSILGESSQMLVRGLLVTHSTDSGRIRPGMAVRQREVVGRSTRSNYMPGGNVLMRSAVLVRVRSRDSEVKVAAHNAKHLGRGIHNTGC